MKISVEQSDINGGITEDCNKCPVALAICRIPGVDPASVKVDGVHIEFCRGGDWVELEAPDRVIRFIEAFDDEDYGDRYCVPFEFDLPVPETTP